MVLLYGLLIAVFIFAVAHLTVDKDIPEGLRTGAWVFFGAVALLYVVFGMIF